MFNNVHNGFKKYNICVSFINNILNATVLWKSYRNAEFVEYIWWPRSILTLLMSEYVLNNCVKEFTILVT